MKPSGPRISVAGSSFMAIKNTSAAPAKMPERISGTVIVNIVPSGDRPSPRADSSSFGLIWRSADRVAPRAAGKNSTR